jgi:hypothetical protein
MTRAWIEKHIKDTEAYMQEIKPKIDLNRRESRILLFVAAILIYGGMFLPRPKNAGAILIGCVALILHIVWDLRGAGRRIEYDVRERHVLGLRYGLQIADYIINEEMLTQGGDGGSTGIQDN